MTSRPYRILLKCVDEMATMRQETNLNCFILFYLDTKRKDRAIHFAWGRWKIVECRLQFTCKIDWQ